MYELGTIIEEAIQYVESGMKTNALDKLSQASMLAEGAGSESAALKRTLAERDSTVSGLHDLLLREIESSATKQVENERLSAEQEAVAVEFAYWLMTDEVGSGYFDQIKLGKGFAAFMAQKEK